MLYICALFYFIGAVKRCLLIYIFFAEICLTNKQMYTKDSGKVSYQLHRNKTQSVTFQIYDCHFIFRISWKIIAVFHCFHQFQG